MKTFEKKTYEATIERKIIEKKIFEEKVERNLFGDSLEERVEILEQKFEEYCFLSDEQIKEIRDLIQLYYDIYGNKRIWSILRHECKFSKLERVPRYKFRSIIKVLYDFVGEPKEKFPIKRQIPLLEENGKHLDYKAIYLPNKKKKTNKKRTSDTAGYTSILSFAFPKD